MAEQILFGDLVNGGTVSIRMNTDKTAIELVPIDEKQIDNVSRFSMSSIKKEPLTPFFIPIIVNDYTNDYRLYLLN